MIPLLAALMLFALLWPAASTAEPAWQLVFADDFTGNTLNPSQWTHDVGAGIWGNEEAQYYTNGKNIILSDGFLILEARKEECEGSAYTSARITTHGTFDFQYGRLEVRAAVPQGRGTWPAIWLLPSENKYGKGVLSGEIDIMEHVGHEPDNFYATVHAQANQDKKQAGIDRAKAQALDPSGFHVYTLLWEPDSITIQMDGRTLLTYAPENLEPSSRWPFQEKFYLVLNLAIGGRWGGQKGIDDTAFPQRMLVDYVYIYQRAER